MLLASVVGCPLAYAADDKPNLAFVDAAPVVLSPDSSGVFKTDLAIKNSGKQGKATVKFAPEQGCTGATLTPGTIQLGSNATVVTHFELTGVSLPANCFIEPVLIALFVCLVISLVVARAAKGAAGKLPDDFKLGSPAWEFAKSWASTATLVGAAISTALTLSALPELTQYASKSGYALLALLISFVVIVAPFVFIAFRTGTPKRDEGKKTYSVEYEGPLCPFLLSSALTVFAGLAQLVVLLILVHEAIQEAWSFAAGVVVGLLLGAALCVYAYRSILLTIQLQMKQWDAAPTEDERRAFQQKNVAVPDLIKGPRVTWPVL